MHSLRDEVCYLLLFFFSFLFFMLVFIFGCERNCCLQVVEGGETEAIRPLLWYPGNFAWHSNFSRMQLRKNQTLERSIEFMNMLLPNNELKYMNMLLPNNELKCYANWCL